MSSVYPSIQPPCHHKKSVPPQAMPLRLSPADESDAPRIAAIHMAAFGPNLLLNVQFPTAAIRAELEVAIADKALADIKDPQVSVLVVRDDDLNKVISFAKWSLPVLEPEMYRETPWRWPRGTNFAVLDTWTEKVEQAAAKVLDGRPYFRTFDLTPCLSPRLFFSSLRTDCFTLPATCSLTLRSHE